MCPADEPLKVRSAVVNMLFLSACKFCTSAIIMWLFFQICASGCHVDEARELGSQKGKQTFLFAPICCACLQWAHKAVTDAWSAPLFSQSSLIRCEAWMRSMFFSNSTVHGCRALWQGPWNSWTWKNRKGSRLKNAIIRHEGKLYFTKLFTICTW